MLTEAATKPCVAEAATKFASGTAMLPMLCSHCQHRGSFCRFDSSRGGNRDAVCGGRRRRRKSVSGVAEATMMLPLTGVITNWPGLREPVMTSGEVPAGASGRTWNARSNNSGVPSVSGCPLMLIETIPAASLTFSERTQPLPAKSSPSLTFLIRQIQQLGVIGDRKVGRLQSLRIIGDADTRLHRVARLGHGPYAADLDRRVDGREVAGIGRHEERCGNLGHRFMGGKPGQVRGVLGVHLPVAAHVADDHRVRQRRRIEAAVFVRADPGYEGRVAAVHDAVAVGVAEIHDLLDGLVGQDAKRSRDCCKINAHQAEDLGCAVHVAVRSGRCRRHVGCEHDNRLLRGPTRRQHSER